MKRWWLWADWLLAGGLVVLALAAALTLVQPGLRDLNVREQQAYGLRPYWEAGFDALSVVCGTGLLVRDIETDYTPRGRCVLVAAGVAGLLLYVAVSLTVVRQLWSGTPPGLLTVWGAHLVAGMVAVVGSGSACVVMGGDDLGWAGWNALAVFASLGIARPEVGTVSVWVYGVIAAAAALGWPVWLLAMSSAWRRQVGRRLLAIVAVYAAGMILAAGLVVVLSGPRGGRMPGGSAAAAGGGAERFVPALVQVVLTSGAGVTSADLSPGVVPDGVRCVFACVLLIGGVAGGVGGGVTWWLVLAAACGRKGVSGGQAECYELSGGLFRQLGWSVLGWVCGLTVVVAAGLMVIEQWGGSAYERPPTAGAAVLDAASAVGGGGLTSGVSGAITSASRSIGIRQRADLYQYGMGWLMLAMLVGRVVPVWCAVRIVRRRVRPDSG